MFKSIIISLSALSLGLSGLTSSIDAIKNHNYFTNQITKTISKHSQQLQINNTIQPVNRQNTFQQDSPQTIINDIANDHIIVPFGTNPLISDPTTQNAIKIALQQANPKITNADLKLIFISPDTQGETLSSTNYNPVTVVAKLGAQFATKQIYVKIASQPAPAINLYNPTTSSSGLNSYTYNPYDDDVFLKSLVYNPNTKTVVSNSTNLQGQDLSDYGIMQKSGNITPGLVLLNRYLHNGFLIYNAHGYIPVRATLATDQNASQKQTLITVNPQLSNANGVNIGDYVQLDLHWDGATIKLMWHLIGEVVAHLLSDAIDTAIGISGFAILKNIVTSLYELLTTDVVTAAVELNVAVDAAVDEIPAIGLLIAGFLAIVTTMLVSDAIEVLQDLIESTFQNNNFRSYVYENWKKQHPSKKQLPSDFTDMNIKYIAAMPPHLSSLMHYNLTFNLRFSSLITNNLVSGNAQWNQGVLLPHFIAPSHFNPSLNTPSFITGNTSDFTIVANADDLDNLDTWIGQYPASGNSIALFKRIGWNSSDELKLAAGLTNQTLRNLQDKPTAWQIPENHFAVIHVQKNTQNKYQIVWSNLANEQTKQALLVSKKGYIAASFINENSFNNITIDESVYLKILARYMWCKNNWSTLRTNPQMQQYKNWTNYFANKVLIPSKVNLYNYNHNYTTIENAMEILGNTFSNGVKMSRTIISSAQLYSIYFNSGSSAINIQTD